MLSLSLADEIWSVPRSGLISRYLQSWGSIALSCRQGKCTTMWACRSTVTSRPLWICKALSIMFANGMNLLVQMTEKCASHHFKWVAGTRKYHMREPNRNVESVLQELGGGGKWGCPAGPWTPLPLMFQHLPQPVNRVNMCCHHISIYLFFFPCNYRCFHHLW